MATRMFVVPMLVARSALSTASDCPSASPAPQAMIIHRLRYESRKDSLPFGGSSFWAGGACASMSRLSSSAVALCVVAMVTLDQL